MFGTNGENPKINPPKISELCPDTAEAYRRMEKRTMYRAGLDPKERTKMLAIVETYWARFPQLRLGQLISNAIGRAYNTDPFYIEDDKLIEALKKMDEELNVGNSS